MISSVTVFDNSKTQIRFGTAISAFIMSEKSHTTSSAQVAPRNTASAYKTDRQYSTSAFYKKLEGLFSLVFPGDDRRKCKQCDADTDQITAPVSKKL